MEEDRSEQIFGSVDLERQSGNSNYNALEMTLRHVSGRLQLLAGYTTASPLDISSSIADELVPGDPHRTTACPAYDVESSFVGSYGYNLPIDMLLRRKNRLTQGWIASGIVRSARLPGHHAEHQR